MTHTHSAWRWRWRGLFPHEFHISHWNKLRNVMRILIVAKVTKCPSGCVMKLCARLLQPKRRWWRWRRWQRQQQQQHIVHSNPIQCGCVNILVFFCSFLSNWIIECVLQNSINKSKRKVTVKMAIKPSSSPHFLAHSVTVLLQFYLHILCFIFLELTISESHSRAQRILRVHDCNI